MNVSQTIFQQLGGNRFAAMTGAKHFMGDKDRLSFRLPRARNAINHVVVILDANDTYTMVFGSLIGSRPYTERSKLSGVYCEDLQRLFTDATGLHTSL